MVSVYAMRSECSGRSLRWLIGAGLLFLRLIAKSIDVSGHMTWAILMGVQCLAHGAPRWFTVLAWCVVLQVLLLKLCVLGGHSGAWGLLAGGTLGVTLLALERGTPQGHRA